MDILLSYQVANLQGIGARRRQEDSFAFANAFDVTMIKQKGLLFVVCDGMGGMADGKLASETAVACIRDGFMQMDVKGDIPGQILSFLRTADKSVYEKLAGSGGSTVVGGIIYDEMLWFFSIGDSCLYLKRGDSIARLNRKMNVCNEIYAACIRTGEILPDKGREDPETEALTSFLGMGDIYDVDLNIRGLKLSDGDVLMAASDGVEGSVTPGDLEEGLANGSAAYTCAVLEDHIKELAKSNQDNYTALVVKCMY